jgi:methyl-accepting chemotaxis protein/methyl-accepting chemotaxis protein-1 (serine sensor receptor)
MKSQITIGKKLALTSGILIVLVAVLGVVSLTGLNRVQKVVESLSKDALDGVSTSSQVESALMDIRGDMLEHVGSSDASQMAALEGKISKLKQEISAAVADVERSVFDDKERDLISKVRPAVDRYLHVWDEVLPLSRATKNEEAYRKLMESAAAFAGAEDAVKAETAFNRQLGKTMAAEAESTQSSVRWMTWLVLAFSVAGGSVLTFFIVRGVNRNLMRAVTELSEGAVQMASAAGQVASSSQHVAQGASEQAATLEETSSAAEEINTTASKNSDGTRDAAKLVAATLQGFADTNESLQQMVVAMGDINASSSKISKIIKVIDEISFQTNILALNAAVEAARAGEAGLGFAVVADEVRNLAQRCAQAAKDTAALIEESVSKSNDGKSKMDQVVEAIGVISGHAAKVKVLVDEVNQSSRQQAQGIEQVAKAVTQMEQVTQGTAANAEESAAAAQELTAQSEAVKGIVAQLGAMVSAEFGRDRGSKF